MNIDQLKKQAKNLRNVFPSLVVDHGSQLTLAQAQTVIAGINGYPSWELMSAKFGDAKPFNPSIADVIQAGLYFDADEEPARMAIAYSRTTGNATRYEYAHETILRFKREQDRTLTEREDNELYEALENFRGNSFSTEFISMAPDDLAAMELQIRSSLKRAPLNIEGHSMLSGVLHALGRYPEAVEASEPVIGALIKLLPSDRKIQASYGFLANRPFYRLLHCHLLVLDRVGRHKEADAMAILGLNLCPMDNIGFRALKTQSLRAKCIDDR